MKPYKLMPCITEAEITNRLNGLAATINHDYQGRELLLIGILKGACIFLSDLARRLEMPVQIDFVRLASYGQKDSSSGTVAITKDIELSVAGRHVLVVEDIIDTGLTLAWYLDYLKKQEPASVKTCAMIDKKERREVEVALDYVGISVESGFLVGYGLDFAEKHRNLPAIYEVQFDE
ncbi:MAG: hypoxanthine phosphoribosyltransferase [Syntrophobacteraceae bacterium]